MTLTLLTPQRQDGGTFARFFANGVIIGNGVSSGLGEDSIFVPFAV